MNARGGKEADGRSLFRKKTHTLPKRYINKRVYSQYNEMISIVLFSLRTSLIQCVVYIYVCMYMHKYIYIYGCVYMYICMLNMKYFHKIT